jgi:uncharacterized protein with HEPN domain
MRKDDLIRLRHMYDAACEAIEFTRSRTRSDLEKDRMLVLSLTKDIEIVGEAAYQISLESRQQLKEIPWDDIIGMRHRLVHAYFDINLDILWQTVTSDLPELIALLKSFFSNKIN